MKNLHQTSVYVINKDNEFNFEIFRNIFWQNSDNLIYVSKLYQMNFESHKIHELDARHGIGIWYIFNHG